MSLHPNRLPRHPGVPFTVLRSVAANTFFKHIIKNTFSNCRQTSKQVAVGSPLGATNFGSFL